MNPAAFKGHLKREPGQLKEHSMTEDGSSDDLEKDVGHSRGADLEQTLDLMQEEVRERNHENEKRQRKCQGSSSCCI